MKENCQSIMETSKSVNFDFKHDHFLTPFPFARDVRAAIKVGVAFP